MATSKLKKAAGLLVSSHAAAQKFNAIRYQLSRKSVVMRTGPVHLSVVTTGRCNLACAMCPTHSPVIPDSFPWKQKTLRDIDFETFRRFADRFSSALSVSFIGSGEPLLNKDLFRMIDYAAGVRRMTVSTVSNGILLEDYAEAIVRAPLRQISVSLNGHAPDEYSRLTGNPPETFPRITRGVSALVRARNAARSAVQIEGSFIVDRVNWRYVPDFLRLAGELGIDHVDLINFLPSPYDGFRAEQRCLFSHDTEIITFLKQAVPREWKGRVSLPVLLAPEKSAPRCSCHFYVLRIDGEENCSSCATLLLNMEGGPRLSDAEVWNSTFFRERRAMFLGGEKEKLLDPCKVCWNNFGVRPWDE
ncbi:MAG: radical SAM protein [Kiritimatiellae bacterium]|nr:radical SAM protein [Kiritimatiellia bacterium]